MKRSVSLAREGILGPVSGDVGYRQEKACGRPGSRNGKRDVRHQMKKPEIISQGGTPRRGSTSSSSERTLPRPLKRRGGIKFRTDSTKRDTSRKDS